MTHYEPAPMSEEAAQERHDTIRSLVDSAKATAKAQQELAALSRCKGEWTGERFAVRAVAESMRANSWKLRAECAESVCLGQQTLIEAQRAIIDRVRALAMEFAAAPFTDRTAGEVTGELLAILDPAPETSADCCVRQMADPMWCHPHEATE